MRTLMRSTGVIVLAAVFAGGHPLSAQMAASEPAPVQMQMGGDAGYRHVTLPAKPGATPLLNETARDSLEHVLHCQCGGCRHDVFTCRSSDLVCSVAPQMHRDIMALVAGGHSAAEIVAAFRSVYGDDVLMSPPRQGFNWLGYLLPFVVILVASLLVYHLLRTWSQRSIARPAAVGISPIGLDATPEELERIRAAMRSDG